MNDELVEERRGHVLILRLDRPAARNALTPGLLAGLGAALLSAESDPEIRCLVLTGTGDRAFCAGMDLQAFSGTDRQEFAEDATAGFQRLVRGETRLPVIGAVNGAAVGGGLELLLGCDVIVAAEHARFGFPEVKRGLFPAGGGTAIGTRIPLAVALEMVLTGDLFDAARALELGLVNAVVPAGDVLDRALGYAGRIGANAPLGLAAAKELVRLGVVDSARAASRLADWQPAVFTSDDAKEGAMAFVEKREPSWTGR